MIALLRRFIIVLALVLGTVHLGTSTASAVSVVGGTVVTEAGDPVADVGVDLWQVEYDANGNLIDYASINFDVTAADGTYEMTSELDPALEYTVGAGYDGGEVFLGGVGSIDDPGLVTFAGDAVPAPVPDLVLPAPSSVTGHVQDTAGAPVANADVSLVELFYDGAELIDYYDVEWTSTDANGDYQGEWFLDPSSVYTVAVFYGNDSYYLGSNSTSPYDEGLVTFTADTLPASLVDLIVPESQVVTGHVQDDTGVAMADVEASLVRIVYDQGQVSYVEDVDWTYTDDAGDYRFDTILNSADTYTVRVYYGGQYFYLGSNTGSPTDPGLVTFTADTIPTDPPPIVVPAPTTLAGTVLDSTDGSGLADANVELVELADDGAGGRDAVSIAATSSGQDGGYAIEAVLADDGTYTLRASIGEDVAYLGTNGSDVNDPAVTVFTGATAPDPVPSISLTPPQNDPAADVAAALAADPSVITGAEWITHPPLAGTGVVATQPVSGFPRSGESFAILSSGRALDTYPDQDTGAESRAGGHVRGDTDYDVTVLRVDVDVPDDANCLTGVDFRFLSDEYPGYVGTSYNDAFILEVDQSTWTTASSEIDAPGTLAFDEFGNLISVNAAGAVTMNETLAEGTTYGGSTRTLTAKTPITPGAHSLYFSIFDQGDHVLDSAVFLDNLTFGHVDDVNAECNPGVKADFGSQVTPQAPEFDDVAASTIIPDVPGVQYLIDDQVVGAGSQPGTPGATTIVTAEALGDSYIQGESGWTHTFAPVPDGLTLLGATAPDFSDVAGSTASYTIPDVAGVTYEVNGEPTAPGTYDAPLFVDIVAVAGEGQAIDGASRWSWVFVEATPTGTNVKAPAPTFTDVGGSADDTYTIPAKLGVRYTVNGDPVAAGTYAVDPAQPEVVVNAVAAVGFVLTGNHQWNHTYSADGVAPGSLSGTVETDAGEPVDGAYVLICSATACYDATTVDGAYAADPADVGNYTIEVWAPSDYGDGYAAASVVSEQHTTVPPIVLTAPAVMPTGTTMTGPYSGTSTAGEVPVVNFTEVLTLIHTAPTGSTVSFQVLSPTGTVWAAGDLTEEGTSGEFTGTIPQLYPNTGDAEVVITVTPPGGGAPTEVAFDIYIDPSGNVVDQFGFPVEGATATLLRAETQFDEFEVVPDGSTIMSPDNRTNPMTTDAAGYFGWDVQAAWYKVGIEKAGCGSTTTPAMQVPPERLNLVIKLTCDTSAGPDSVGVPTIDGPVVEGGTLTADAGDLPDGYSAVGYQWYADDAAIDGATGETFEIGAAQLGTRISVEATIQRSATPYDPLVPEEKVTFDGFGKRSAKTATVLGAPEPPSVAGTAKVGVELTATVGDWTDAYDEVAYAWLVDGAPVDGATTLVYTPRAADAGKTIAFQVTATSAGRDPVVAASEEQTVAKGTLVRNGTLAVGGTAKVGETLTVATEPTWTPGSPAPTVAYQWLRDGTPIPAATQSSYVLTGDDNGAAVSVRLTASKAGYDDDTVTSDPQTVAPGTLERTGVAVVSGTGEVGETLMIGGAGLPTWSPEPTVAYQWLRDGVAIPGATGASYELVLADAGTSVSVEVTASKDHYESDRVTSEATNVAAVSTAKPRIKGKAKVGRTLTATKGSWVGAGYAFKYQWYANGKAIKKATKTKLKLTKKLGGKRITVKVTATKADFPTVSATSKPKTVKKAGR